MPVSLDKLINSGLNNTYQDFAYTLKETTRAAATSTPLISGYEFEGAKYFDGKMQKIYHNGSWQDHLDFSKVDYTDVRGAPVITNNVEETNLDAVPVLRVVQKYADENIYYYRPAGYEHNSFSFNTRRELNAGRNYSSQGKNGKVNDYNQTIYIKNNGSKITIRGTAVISPSLSNARILIQYRKEVPAGFVMDSGGVQLTGIGMGPGAGSLFTFVGDWGQPDSTTGFWLYIYDPGNAHQGWTSNPENGYQEKEYRVFWSVTYVNLGKTIR